MGVVGFGDWESIRLVDPSTSLKRLWVFLGASSRNDGDDVGTTATFNHPLGISRNRFWLIECRYELHGRI